MNPAELNYTAVSTFDQNERHSNMDSEKNVEKGLKYRQFLAATIGKKYLQNNSTDRIIALYSDFDGHLS